MEIAVGDVITFNLNRADNKCIGLVLAVGLGLVYVKYVHAWNLNEKPQTVELSTNTYGAWVSKYTENPDRIKSFLQ